MTTRGNFLNASVRTELNDLTAGAYVWSDGLLQTFLADALNQLSLDYPPIKELTIAAVSGQADYPLDPAANPVGPGGIISVQYPPGFLVQPGRTDTQYLQMFPTISATSTWQPYEQRWEFLREMSGASAQLLRFRYALTPPSPTSIIVRYYGQYTFPAVDTASLDVEVFEEIALKWAVCARAYQWLDEQRGKRSGSVSVPAATGSAAYYDRLYQAALLARKKSAGIKSSKVIIDG